MKKLFFIASFFMLLGMTACSSKDRDVLAVEQLAHRLIPQYADRFVFEIAPEEDRDYYSLESKDGKIHISGNNANSIAAGLNYYLKYYCLDDCIVVCRYSGRNARCVAYGGKTGRRRSESG